MIALVKSVVLEVPPKSPVIVFPSRMVLSTAFSMRDACVCMPRWRSIMMELSSSAVGFALFFPATMKKKKEKKKKRKKKKEERRKN